MRIVETRVTQKGQVTIPAEIRARFGIKPKDKVLFEVEGESIRLKTSPSKLLAGYGAVKPRQRPEDWKKFREDLEQAIAEEAAGKGI